MAGWTANDILGELTAVASLLGARTPPPDSAEAMMAAYDKLKRSVLASLCSKIGGMVVLDAAGALELMNAVINSNLPDAAKIDLQEALDDKLNASSESAIGASWGVQKRPQILLHPTNYLSEQDWVQLMDPETNPFRCTMVVVQRFKSLGMKSLHEQTVRWAVALLVCLWSDKINKLPAYSLIFELVQNFKKAFETASSLSGSRLPMLPRFPEHTADLPEGFVEKAYGSDPPVVKSLEKLAHVAGHHVPLRCNSKLLTTGQTGSTAASGLAAQPMAELIRQTIMQVHGQHQQQQPHIQMLQHGLGNQPQANQQHQQPHQQPQMLQPALGDYGCRSNSNWFDSSSSPPNDSPPNNSPPNNSPTTNSPPSAAAVAFKPHSRLNNLALDDSPAQPASFAQVADSGQSASGLGLDQPPGSAQPKGFSTRVNSEDYENAAFRAACVGAFKKETSGRGKGRGNGRGRGKPVQPTSSPKASSFAMPAQPKASPKASSSAMPKKRPAANMQRDANGFGCPKCRHSPNGCTQCKSPDYVGRGNGRARGK
jgi:hypothetical protein